MALVFGRFDTAPAEVRQALLDFVASKAKEERRAAAMTVLEAAVDNAPDITSKDLTRIVRDLLREGIILGFIGKGVDVMHLSLHFQHLTTPRPGWNGLPDGSDKILTLAEISALHVAGDQRQNSHHRRDFNR
ncbi:hypothetical protein [Leisingera caerulea]|uniref:hypothetical protein n=1 Tax=Leisingera caerulea TaxID=506591 RepID=UPI0021A7FF3E|nr:hypothetical protein [Leisingera caerulea]UWQ83090.1 hypothetical protein K3726_15690 [Leisingera caerulea]